MIFLALLPALGWGLMPVIAQISKGKPNEQLLGTTVTALLFGGLFFVFAKPEWSLLIVVVGFLSGAFWAVGQYLQFYSFIELPVSEAMPISNGTQLIGTTLVAALFFNEWASPKTIGWGIVSILVIIVGIYLTNYREKLVGNTVHGTLRPVIVLLLSSAALTVYVVLPRFFQVSGAAIIFPQAIGMFVTVFGMNVPRLKKVNGTSVAKNMLTGFAWSVANVSLFLVMPTLGVGKSFTVAQLAVLVSLAVGMLVFKPKKTKKEMTAIFVGAFLITAGILLMSLLKNG